MSTALPDNTAIMENTNVAVRETTSPGVPGTVLPAHRFQGFSDTGALRDYARVSAAVDSPVNGMETGRLDLGILDGGTMTQKLSLTDAGIALNDDADVTGTLTLAGDPAQPLEAATKQYVDANAFTPAERTKLNGIEDGATADQTAAEIKTAYESNLDTNAFTDADQAKLASIEAGATGDQTPAEIKTAYESNLNTNAFTDVEKTKLAGIEDGATADQTAAEIKAAYESNANTNAFTDTDQAKLNGIEAGATADQTAAEIKLAYESNLNTNAFTDADQAKLNSVEAGATADQTATEIKAAYESNPDTNAFTDAEQAKLAGLGANAAFQEFGGGRVSINNDGWVIDPAVNTSGCRVMTLTLSCGSGNRTGFARIFLTQVTTPSPNDLVTGYSGIAASALQNLFIPAGWGLYGTFSTGGAVATFDYL